MIIKIVAATKALSKFPSDKFKNMTTGNVSVFILIEPASIKAVPNSPRVLVQVIIIAVINPFLARGRLTLKNVPKLLYPKVLDINSNLGIYILKSCSYNPNHIRSINKEVCEYYSLN